MNDLEVMLKDAQDRAERVLINPVQPLNNGYAAYL